MAKVTKQEFIDHCNAIGVEITDESGNTRHIHAYTPNNFKFKNIDLHNQGLHDDNYGVPVNWTQLKKDVELVPCDNGNECEYCYGKMDV